MRYERAIILMTAIVPSTGHVDMVNFATSLAGKVTLIISTRSFEPTNFYERAAAFGGTNARLVNHHDDFAEQEPTPENEKHFWAYWKDVVLPHVSIPERTCIVASENYGVRLSQEVGVDFVPYDPNREINPARGSDLRESLYGKWLSIAPQFRLGLRTSVVLFGPESTGKTTMAKNLAAVWGGYFIPEWARPYLEVEGVGHDVTTKKLITIAEAQFALEKHIFENFDEKPYLFFDTDIVTTLGFCELYKENEAANIAMKKVQLAPRKDVYIVMNDAIGFTPDPLRYGGDKRESETEYWTNMLNRFGLNYYVVKSTTRGAQMIEVSRVIEEVAIGKTEKIEKFKRSQVKE